MTIDDLSAAKRFRSLWDELSLDRRIWPSVPKRPVEFWGKIGKNPAAGAEVAHRSGGAWLM
jgi:hypothetical protein